MRGREIDLFNELSASGKHRKAAAIIKADKQIALLIDAQTVRCEAIMPAVGKIYDDHGTPPKTQPDESHSGSVRQNQNHSPERTRGSAPTTTAPRREVHLTPGR